MMIKRSTPCKRTNRFSNHIAKRISSKRGSIATCDTSVKGNLSTASRANIKIIVYSNYNKETTDIDQAVTTLVKSREKKDLGEKYKHYHERAISSK